MPWRDPGNWLPFLLGATRSGDGPHLNLQRIAEALLIAAVAGGVSAWAAQQVLADRISRLQVDVAEVRTDVRDLRDDLYDLATSRR